MQEVHGILVFDWNGYNPCLGCAQQWVNEKWVSIFPTEWSEQMSNKMGVERQPGFHSFIMWSPSFADLRFFPSQKSVISEKKKPWVTSPHIFPLVEFRSHFWFDKKLGMESPDLTNPPWPPSFEVLETTMFCFFCGFKIGKRGRTKKRCKKQYQVFSQIFRLCSRKFPKDRRISPQTSPCHITAYRSLGHRGWEKMQMCSEDLRTKERSEMEAEVPKGNDEAAFLANGLKAPILGRECLSWGGDLHWNKHVFVGIFVWHSFTKTFNISG